MSKYSSTQRTVVLLVAIISSVALVVPEFFALTHPNQNSADPAATQNDNTGATNMTRGMRRRSRRRGMRRGTRRTRSMGADTTGANDNTTGTADTSGAATTTTNTGGGMSDDLSGSYTGTISMPEHNMSGPATLTVTGNSYTLDAGGMTHSGRFVANTTRGYTAVTMELGPTDAGQTPTFISVRARRLGNGGLSLMSVPGEAHQFSFTTAGGGRRGGRRTRGMRGMGGGMGSGAGNTNTGADTTMTTGDNTNTGDMSGTTGTGTGRRRGRRGRRGTRGMGDMNMNANTSDTTNTNTSDTTMTGDNTNTGDMSGMNGNMNTGRRRRGRRGRRSPGTNMNGNMNMSTNNNMTP